MKKVFCLLFLFSLSLFAQVETVPLDNPVYDYLKLMSVKGIIKGYDSDMPVISRQKTADYLAEVEDEMQRLSSTELSLLRKYQVEFDVSKQTPENTTELFGPGGFFENFGGTFEDKYKFVYGAEDTATRSNLYFEFIGQGNYIHQTEPHTQNAWVYQMGFNMRGTAFGHLGYNLTVIKGAASGNYDLAETYAPWLNYNFKYVEGIENIAGYDFTNGYLRYHAEPYEDMDIDLFLGRDKITFGYGYGNSMVFSGNHPDFDFFSFNFQYGAVNFYSMHGSAVGEFSLNRDETFTKYIAANRLKISLEGLFDVGIAEALIYSGRGLEFAYLPPLQFYKFAEHSIQDRDNALLFMDFQSNFLDNFEIQGTFMLDENLLSNMQDLTKYVNKTGYQLGFFWYEPFSLSDLSLVFEFTRIRPYVYSHNNHKNTFTAWGTGLGHPIGPNAEEILARAGYNLNDYVYLEAEYRRVNEGNSIYDGSGNLLYNAGGDLFQPWRNGIDPLHIEFLSGARVNTDFLKLTCRFEPIRDLPMILGFMHQSEHHIDSGSTFDNQYLWYQLKVRY